MRPDALILAALVALLWFFAPQVQAETEVSLYGGVQSAEPGDVSGADPVLGLFAFVTKWPGRSLESPPYWGVRLTQWHSPRWGLAVELNHAKLHADAEAMAAAGFDRLEFSDGFNLLTVNAMRRFPQWGRLEPYAGAGLGLAVPHVEVTTPSGATSGYQVTGPAVVWIAGASVPVRDRGLRLFAEYKGSRSWNRARLEGGGTLEADFTTHALNLGLSLRF
jgi:lipid A oxidase